MRNRLAILTVATLLPLTAGASLAAASQADALAPIGKVTLTGTVEDCDSDSSPTDVKIKAGTETKVDNSLAGNSNSYSVTFKKIPTGGTATGKATVTCEDETTYKAANFTIKGSPNTSTVKQKQNLEPQ
ncbi:hypothetical protein PV396_18660 [Streptomyces sp. ME02-8801-2C]|uniref:hypothetical protein n=1 Tax=Streptomyces sp. ME02-8801-2C TaxID=3028680 RepID=UPI0029A2BEAB|nr:hypothetical protein [Streptomyces sp. ME02-8801-2C]MDX3453944.1 hypothetical protein [Streptomyces sp. ME02-8801-2C]